MVPFYIPHKSAPTELAVKIMTYRLKRGSTGAEQLTEEKSVTLDSTSLELLVEGVKVHQLVAARPSGGRYILIKSPENTAEIGDMEPAAAAGSLLRVLSRPDIAKHISTHVLDDTLADALRAALRLQEVRRAIDELRSHLEQKLSDEALYQEWCRRHSWAFGIAHVEADSVRHIAVGDTVDLLLPSLLSGYRDVVELKRPDMNVLLFDAQHRNYYFSPETSKAIGQVHRYLDMASEQLHSGLHDHPQVVAYHPRATIVIGRSGDWPQTTLKALHGLNSRLHGITVMTFDQLLAQAEHFLKILTDRAK